MVAIWLPATNHCRLEQIPWLAFLTCCDQDNSIPHQDNGCETDNCAAVEQGLYKTEDCRITLSVPLFSQLLVAVPSADDPLQETHTPQRFPATTSFVRPASWQFQFRAAAPPRAPSLVS